MDTKKSRKNSLIECANNDAVFFSVGLFEFVWCQCSNWVLGFGKSALNYSKTMGNLPKLG